MIRSSKASTGIQEFLLPVCDPVLYKGGLPACYSRMRDLAEEISFLGLVRRVRMGDQEASAATGTAVYETGQSGSRSRAAEHRGSDACSIPVDICQSVFGNFFVRTHGGPVRPRDAGAVDQAARDHGTQPAH